MSPFATPGPFGWHGVGLDTPEVWFLEAFDGCWSLHRPFSICQWNALDSHRLPDAARLDCRAAAAHDGSPVLALHSFFWSPDGAPTGGSVPLSLRYSAYRLTGPEDLGESQTLGQRL